MSQLNLVPVNMDEQAGPQQQQQHQQHIQQQESPLGFPPQQQVAQGHAYMVAEVNNNSVNTVHTSSNISNVLNVSNVHVVEAPRFENFIVVYADPMEEDETRAQVDLLTDTVERGVQQFRDLERLVQAQNREVTEDLRDIYRALLEMGVRATDLVRYVYEAERRHRTFNEGIQAFMLNTVASQRVSDQRLTEELQRRFKVLEDYFLTVEARFSQPLAESYVTNVEARLLELENSSAARLSSLEERVQTLEAQGEVLATRGQHGVDVCADLVDEQEKLVEKVDLYQAQAANFQQDVTNKLAQVSQQLAELTQTVQLKGVPRGAPAQDTDPRRSDIQVSASTPPVASTGNAHGVSRLGALPSTLCLNPESLASQRETSDPFDRMKLGEEHNPLQGEIRVIAESERPTTAIPFPIPQSVTGGERVSTIGVEGVGGGGSVPLNPLFSTGLGLLDPKVRDLVARTVPLPKFSGEGSDWNDFIESWQRWWRLSGLPDAYKHEIFKETLPSATRTLMDKLIGKRNWGYAEIFQHLSQTYKGYDNRFTARAKWEGLAPPQKMSVLTFRHWYETWVLYASAVPAITFQQLSDQFLKVMPDQWKRRIARQSRKVDSRRKPGEPNWGTHTDMHAFILDELADIEFADMIQDTYHRETGDSKKKAGSDKEPVSAVVDHVATCGHCGTKGHSDSKCWKKHPHLRPPPRTEQKGKEAAPRSQSRPQPRQLTPHEENLYKQKKCFWCEKEGHRVSECPAKLALQRREGNQPGKNPTNSQKK